MSAYERRMWLAAAGAAEASILDYEQRVVQLENGKWSVRDGNGYLGCVHEYDTEAEAAAWLEGYDTGARENM